MGGFFSSGAPAGGGDMGPENMGLPHSGMSMLGSGAGRFMLNGLPPIQASAPTNVESWPQAYQPNYSLFYNPREMLQAGQPSFQDPMWYQSTAAAPPPEPAGPDMSNLYTPWWSGQMPRSPGVNVMAMDPAQRVLYLNRMVNPAQFQELGGNDLMGGRR